MDEFLLCDEVWDMSPMNTPRTPALDHNHNRKETNTWIHPITKEDWKNSFDNCLRKETKYMPGSGYLHFLESNAFLSSCRFKSIQWLIHSQRRFNFCIGTIFNAVNYFDRFIHTNQCHGWSYWMMDLLSVACLTIATKFGETSPPSLHEIQEGLDYCFEAKLIQRMELKIMESLRWELNSITPYSYVELIVWELNSHFEHHHIVLEELSSRIHDILLASSLDDKLLEFRPCVIVISVLTCVLENHEDCLSHIASFVPPDQTENLQTCGKMMRGMLVKFCKSEATANPSSPHTVLTKEQVAIYEEQVDLSFIDGPNNAKMSNVIKRKRGHKDGCFVKHKKCVD